MADDEYRYRDSVEIAAPPDTVYDLVSDVTRTGEWSPICVGCSWDPGDEPDVEGPRVGAHFTGRNEVPGRTWETRSQVIAARRGEEFAWEVNGGLVAWGYRLQPAGSGTRLTEWWEFRPAGRQFFRDKYGDQADAQIADRVRAAHEGILATLAALKRIAEER